MINICINNQVWKKGHLMNSNWKVNSSHCWIKQTEKCSNFKLHAKNKPMSTFSSLRVKIFSTGAKTDSMTFSTWKLDREKIANALMTILALSNNYKSSSQKLTFSNKLSETRSTISPAWTGRNHESFSAITSSVLEQISNNPTFITWWVILMNRIWESWTNSFENNFINHCRNSRLKLTTRFSMKNSGKVCVFQYWRLYRQNTERILKKFRLS